MLLSIEMYFNETCVQLCSEMLLSSRTTFYSSVIQLYHFCI